jgi:hypothetical protein
MKHPTPKDSEPPRQRRERGKHDEGLVTRRDGRERTSCEGVASVVSQGLDRFGRAQGTSSGGVRLVAHLFTRVRVALVFCTFFCTLAPFFYVYIALLSEHFQIVATLGSLSAV